MSNYQWLEQLPSNWTTYSLGHVARVSTGTADVQDAEPDGHFPFYVRSPHILRLDRYTNDTEAVITAGDGNVGDIFHIARGRFAAHQRVYVIEPGSRLEIRFLAYVMAATFKASLSGNTAKSTVESLRRPMLTGFRVPGPPLSAQRIIADYLDRETSEIGALVSDLQIALRLREERTQSAIDRTILASSLSHVALKRFGLSITAGVSVNASTYPATECHPGVLKTGSVSKGYFDPHENKAVENPHEIARLSTPVTESTIIVNRANTPDLVGSAALVDRQIDNLYLSDLLWQVHVEHADPAYIAAYMQTRAYRDSIDLIRVGTSASMQKISQENFAKIPIPAFPPAQQAAIANEVSRARQEFREAADDINRAVTLAKERRAALITAAVTGQIDVTAKRRPAAEQLEDDIKELS